MFPLNGYSVASVTRSRVKIKAPLASRQIIRSEAPLGADDLMKIVSEHVFLTGSEMIRSKGLVGSCDIITAMLSKRMTGNTRSKGLAG